MGDLSIDILKALIEKYAPPPTIIRSRFCPTGTGYKMTHKDVLGVSTKYIIVNPNDYPEQEDEI